MAVGKSVFVTSSANVVSEKHTHTQVGLGRRVPMKGKRWEMAWGRAFGSEAWPGRRGKDLVGQS